jgi:menaquinone-dependent protoporphyrinogen oxidase
MRPVLVAYASKYGSTREVAQAVAKRLEERGVATEVRPARDVSGVEQYEAVVLGTAFYFFSMLGEAKRFLRRHAAHLPRDRFAMFGMGPVEDEPEQFDGLRDQIAKGLAKFPGLEPAAIGVFGGVLVHDRLRFPDNMPAMKAVPENDLRDWEAIGDWADRLPEELGLSID